MMGLPMTIMAGFLAGIGIVDRQVREVAEVSEVHGVGTVVETLRVRMISPLEVVVEVREETVVFPVVLEAQGTIG